MAIRLRLALWYGALFAAILVVVGALTYALHVRGHYDDLDRALITSAAHAATDGSVIAGHTGGEGSGMEVFLRRYTAAGELHLRGPADPSLPIDVGAIRAGAAGPAYGPLVALAPPLAGVPEPGTGSFGTVRDHAQRWRAYVLPLPGAGGDVVVAMAPLGRLDAAVAAFRLALVTLGVLGIVAALAGGWAIAGRALRPIDELTRTARDIAVARDVSHRVPEPPHTDELGRLAETFNAMLASLEEAQRSQQRFVADASHELRAPLTTIQGNLELVRRADLPAAERAEALGEAEREATRLGRLVTDLLALAHADSGADIRRAPVDLDALVLDVFQAARPLAHGRALTLDPLEPVQVCGDADRLTQLVLILLDNALKYTPEDGSVTLGLRQDGGHVEIHVRDTGVGIGTADLAHVFERFYRADPARGRDPGGTGLGLSIARWIVVQHGGTIDLQSQPGQGTRVSVQLPLLP